MYSKIQSRSETKQEIIELNITSVRNPDHDCAGQTLVEARSCGKSDDNNCEIDQICSQPPMRGNCNQPPEVRYFFNKATSDCGMYLYTGCPGGRNDFDNYTTCLEFCMSKEP